MATERGRTGILASLCVLALCSATGAPASAAEDEEPAALPQLLPELPGPSCAPGSDEVIDQEVWTENALGLPEARTTTTGAGTTVAVVGSGVDDTSAALSGAVRGGGEDCTGYGTFLAGVVAARPLEDSGLIGVAPDTEIAAFTVTDDQGAADADAVSEGINEAVDFGADVVLVGVELALGSSDLDTAVDAAVSEDVLVVAPSTAVVQGTLYAAAPATRSEVLGVLANGTDGATWGEASVDQGPAASPDISAPGEAVMSLAPGGEGHAVAEGDAVAAAFVAGTAALVRAEYPDLSAARTAERLTSSAYPNHDAGTGAGAVDPVGALSRTLGPASGEGAEPEALALSPPVEPTKGRVLALVGLTALFVAMAGVGAAAARRRRTGGAAGQD